MSRGKSFRAGGLKTCWTEPPAPGRATPYGRCIPYGRLGQRSLLRREHEMNDLVHGRERMGKLLRHRASAARAEGARKLRTAMSFSIAGWREAGRDMKGAVRAMLMRYP